MNTETIKKIVIMEWEMFQKVNEGAPKASCQEDFPTFSAMRSGQFAAWSEAAAESYLEDLENAENEGRNLLMDKYIHMMSTTAPARYEKIMQDRRKPSESVKALAKEICEMMITQTIPLHEQFPCVAGSGRPLRSSYDFSGVTSIETYQYGELLTYSEKTLKLLHTHIKSLEAEGESLARTILLNAVRYYGYETLEQAEEAMQAYADSQPIEWSFGCESCSEDICLI